MELIIPAAIAERILFSCHLVAAAGMDWCWPDERVEGPRPGPKLCAAECKLGKWLRTVLRLLFENNTEKMLQSACGGWEC